MAAVIKPKRAGTASSVPTTSNLADGELAINSADKKIYIRSGTSIITVAVGEVTTSEISSSTLVVESEGISSNDNDSTIPTSAATKDFVDSTVSAMAIALG